LKHRPERDLGFLDWSKVKESFFNSFLWKVNL